MEQEEILRRISIINVKNKLELNEISSKKDIIYVKCPFCCLKKGTMILNTTNNSYVCKNCRAKGYSVGLYAKCKYMNNKTAYKKLISNKADMSNNLMNFIVSNEKRDDEELDSVYQAFLNKLSLNEEHKIRLLTYGFTIQEIEKIGFKTIPTQEKEKKEICKNLINEGLELAGVPGFFKDIKFEWTFKSHKGIFIPVVNEHRNKVIALRIHLDTIYSCDTTDIWFSSSQDNGGSKVNNNIMILYPRDSNIRLINDDKRKEDIIIASEIILAYKLSITYKDRIIIGVPNIIPKKETNKLNKIRDVNNVYVVVDYHTMVHNVENLLLSLETKYNVEKINLFMSLKCCQIPESLKSKFNKEKEDLLKNIA